MKKILIIGGTQFVGRKITEMLVRDGRYELCLFNRGKTNPDLFPGVRKIIGDRYTADIELIGKEEWDCIIDVTAYYPDNLRRTLQIVKDLVGQYILISTMSVYKHEPDDELISEDHPLLECNEEQRNSDEMSTYGARKAACERELQSMADMDYLILRPMLIVGPYDPTDRLYYWLYRTQFYEEIAVPENGVHHIGGWTDVDDFAELVIRSIGRNDLEKVYHVPTAAKVSIDQVLRIASKQLGKNPKRTSVSREAIDEQGLRVWLDVPLWVGKDYYVLDDTKLKRDFAIKFRSVEESIRNSIDYFASKGWYPPEYGMSREQEEALMKKGD